MKERFGGRMFVTQRQPTFLEFVGPMVGKGRGPRTPGQELGIAREEVVAVGDGLNDLDMIAARAWAWRWQRPPRPPREGGPRDGVLAEDGVAVLIEQLIAEGAI